MISEFTKNWCRELCGEKYIENEIRRLKQKAEDFKSTDGNPTEAMRERDEQERRESDKLLDIFEGRE